jgi:hypothetical protein
VDADALNKLFQSKEDAPTGDPRVSFSYAGYRITIRSRGEVVLRSETDAERQHAE